MAERSELPKPTADSPKLTSCTAEKQMSVSVRGVQVKFSESVDPHLLFFTQTPTWARAGSRF